MTDYSALLELGGNKTWKMPQLTGFNKLPPRATLYPYPTALSALTNDRSSSPWFVSLNGTWDFQYFPRPEAVTDDAIQQKNWGPI